MRATDASGTAPRLREPRRARRAPTPRSSRRRSRRSRHGRRQGQTLQARSGGWSAAPASLAYQWQRCNANGRLCTPIAGATASRVHGRRPPTPGTRSSPSSARRSAPRPRTRSAPRRARRGADGPAARALPAVTGTAQQGSAAAGTDRDLVRARARSPTRTSGTAATRPARTASRSTARRAPPTRWSRRTSGRRSASPSAPPTRPGRRPPTRPSSAPSRPPARRCLDRPADDRGHAEAGQTLQAANGEWSSPPSSFAYQWQRCTLNVRLCVPDPRRDRRGLRRHRRRRRPRARRERPGDLRGRHTGGAQRRRSSVIQRPRRASLLR